jgi:hypothetical protein
MSNPSTLVGLRCDHTKNRRFDLVHDRVDWVGTHRNGFKSPLRHARICQRDGATECQLDAAASPIWSSTAAAKRASTATTTASPRTHPHPHPYHSGDQDDEGVTFSSEGQHLTTTVDPWFWQRSAPSPHPTEGP